MEIADLPTRFGFKKWLRYRFCENHQQTNYLRGQTNLLSFSPKKKKEILKICAWRVNVEIITKSTCRIGKFKFGGAPYLFRFQSMRSALIYGIRLNQKKNWATTFSILDPVICAITVNLGETKPQNRTFLKTCLKPQQNQFTIGFIFWKVVLFSVLF